MVMETTKETTINTDRIVEVEISGPHYNFFCPVCGTCIIGKGASAIKEDGKSPCKHVLFYKDGIENMFCNVNESCEKEIEKLNDYDFRYGLEDEDISLEEYVMSVIPDTAIIISMSSYLGGCVTATEWIGIDLECEDEWI
jgi:predicted RNA-binding Zn-ribbon protein involved in translation (DUF1610 family)